MNHNDSRLLRHLLIAITLKLVALAAIWWWFVADHRVSVDAAGVADRLGAPSAPSQTPPSLQGAQP